MVSLIVAHAKQNVIGFKGDMPWSLSADLKRLKKLTTGNTIVMGRRTFETLGRPLPNRTNVVLTRDKNFSPDGVTVIYSIDEIKNLEGKVFIFGGNTLYEQTMDIVDEMFVTIIDETFGGDTFFPEYDLSEWTVESEEAGTVDDKNRNPHRFLHLTREL